MEVIYPLHLRLVQPPHVLSQPPLVQSPNLLQQDHGILGQAVSFGRELNVGGQTGLAGLGRNGRRDYSRTVAVARVILHNKHRTHTPLLAAHHRAQVGIKNVSTFDAVIHKSSHSAGK